MTATTQKVGAILKKAGFTEFGDVSNAPGFHLLPSGHDGDLFVQYCPGQPYPKGAVRDTEQVGEYASTLLAAGLDVENLGTELHVKGEGARGA